MLISQCFAQGRTGSRFGARAIRQRGGPQLRERKVWRALRWEIFCGHTSWIGLKIYLTHFCEWFSIRVAFCYLPFQVMFDRLTKTKCIFYGAENKCERSEQSWGSGGLPPGKILITTPLRLLENALFGRFYHLKKQRSITSDGVLPENLRKLLQFHE